MATQIKLRRDTYQNWFDNNPVLGLAEPGYDTTNKKLKIGDGVTTWRLLPYFDDKETDLSAVAQNIVPSVDSNGTTGYTLGSPSFKWKELFVSNGSIYIGDVKLSNVAGKLVATKVVNPGEDDEAEDPDDSDAASEIGNGGGIQLPSQSGQEGKFLTTDGDELSWATVTGGDADLGSFTIESNILSVNSGTDIYIETYETDGDGESRLILKPQEDDDGDNPTRIEGSYGVGIWANTTGTAKKWLFGSDGDLKLPAGGDIVDSSGNSVLGGGGGGAVVDRAVSFPNGEAGDTEGTLANDNGVLYFCTADYVDFNQYIDTPFSLETNQDFLVGQTGNLLNVATISRESNAFVLFILENGGTTASDWSITMTDGDFGGAQTCTAVGFNVDDDINFLWTHRNDDPNSIPEGSTFTVTYTGTLNRPAIWERISGGGNLIEYYDEVLDYTSSVELTGDFRVDVDDAHLEVDGDGYWSLGSNNYDTKIFSTSRTGPDPVDITIRANDNDWVFKSDGGLAFPDGTLQTTAYTGQSGGVTSRRFVAVSRDGKVYGSTDGENWTSYVSPITNISEVAVGPNRIVYVAANSNDLESRSLWYATAYNSTPTEVAPPENVLEYYERVYYFSSIEKYVAVGYVAEGNDFPILLHSSDGITWTRSYVSEELITELGVSGSVRFEDIAENDLGFFVVSDDSDLGGFFLENITDPLDSTTHVDQTTDFDHVVWVETANSNLGGWHAFESAEEWYHNPNPDPRQGTFANFALEDDIDDITESQLGVSVDIRETAVGVHNGVTTLVLSTQRGHILYWPVSNALPTVVIPEPYTSSISDIIRGTITEIEWTGDYEPEESGEKIVITGVTTQQGEPGTTNQSYNGIKYIKNNGGIYELYTDQALTTPWNTTTYWPVNTNTGTLTWSHGADIDALHYDDGVFYIGNDNHQLFRSTTGGATWTQLGTDEGTADFEYISSYGTVVADTTTVVSQDTAPTADNGSLWFNTAEGRLYIKYSDAWIDAAPLVQPPPDTDIDVNSITFADASVLTSVADLTPNKLVNGDNELVLATDGTLTFPGGNISVGSIQGQEVIIGSTNATINVIAQGATGVASLGWAEDGIDSVIVGSNVAAVTVNSPGNSSPGTVEITTGNSGIGTNIWEFRPDGTTKFPNGVIRPPLGDNTTTIESENGLTSLEVANGSVVITAQTSTENTWTFGTNGSLTFPDNTVQTTAYTGSNVQGEYIYAFNGTNTELTITNVNFNLLFCTVANAYAGSATHTVNLPAGTPGQRLVVINSTTLCTLVVSGAGEGDSSVTVNSGPAEYIYTTNEGWFAMYGTV
jgi:hypothetical protein